MKLILLSLTLIAITASSNASENTSQIAENLTVGALFPLSGDLSSFGASEQLALRLAEGDINQFLSDAGRDMRVNLVIKDTVTDPKVTLEALKELQAQGVNIIVGPDDSASLAGVREYALENGLILISPSSTAPSLALANDTIFRLSPDDIRLGIAIAALMREDGIRAAVVLGRKDIWADELINATSFAFAEKGGAILEEVRYDPGTTNFSLELNLLKDGLNDALVKYDPQSVAVFMASFDEGTSILSQAYKDPKLSAVRWYAGDVSAVPESNDSRVREFAKAVRFVYPMYGDERSQRYRQMEGILGHDLDPYAVNAYDALWLIASTYLMAGSDDPEIIQRLLPEVAGSRMGSYGSLALNQVGDRDYASYAFMAPFEVNGTLEWMPVARYTSGLNQGEDLQIIEHPLAEPSMKVLVVNSYHPGWALEEDLVTGIQEGLAREGFFAGEDYRLKVFWMDTKVNHTTPEAIKAQGAAALALIDEWMPDIVFVNNDNAVKYVAVAYAESNPESQLPFIFAGTNIDPSIYVPIGSLEHPAGMITGTLERLPFETAFAEAKKVLPNATRMLFLSDASPSSVDAKREFDVWYSLHGNDSTLQLVDFVQTNDFEEWKRIVESSQNSVDMMGFIGYQQIRDADGRLLPAVEVASWTTSNSDLPELDLIPTDARYGMLMGAGISYYKTGMYGGIVGGKVLKGASPDQFPIVDPKVVELTFNRLRADDLNVTVPVDSLVRADEVYE